MVVLLQEQGYDCSNTLLLLTPFTHACLQVSAPKRRKKAAVTADEEFVGRVMDAQQVAGEWVAWEGKDVPYTPHSNMQHAAGCAEIKR
jgi:hypothetical protein